MPRDKRQCISPNILTSSSQSSPENHVFRFEPEYTSKQQNNSRSYENIMISHSPQCLVSDYDNGELVSNHSTTSEQQICGSPYENINIPNFQHSPRTRIKTFIGGKDK